MIDDVTLARALHVLFVVHWIGGVGFVTLVVLPLAKSRPNAEEALALLTGVERRFAAQVRITMPLAGATGLWMTWRMELWDRFLDPHFWWMGAMLGLWLFFMLMLFVLEPLLHARFEERARRDPPPALRKMITLHAVLFAFAALTILGAVAGAHGLVFF
ncbi:MAG: hypothetical protein ACHQAY_18010 [Hyphomicrobiales bacterium]